MTDWREYPVSAEGLRGFGPVGETRDSGEPVQPAGPPALLFPETRHLLEPTFELAPSPALTLAWTGTVAAGFFESHPHTWMGPGRDRLLAICDGLESERLVLLPHARHVLNDAAGARSFLLDRPGIKIALAPARLFEPGMLNDASDHLRCFIRMLGPLCSFVFREDVVADGEACRTVAPGAGRLPMDQFDALVQEYAPVDVPIITPGGGEQEPASRIL